MASEEALARDPCLSEALTQAIADPVFNLKLRGEPARRKRVVTYSAVRRAAPEPEKPELNFGTSLVKDYVCGPAYDRKSEVVMSGQAYVRGESAFVLPGDAKDGRTSFPTSAPIQVREEGSSPPRRLYEPRSRLGSVHSRPSSAQTRPGSARSRSSVRPGSAGSSRPRPGSAGSRRPGSARPPRPRPAPLLSQDEGEPSERYDVGTPSGRMTPDSRGSIAGGRWKRVRSLGSFVHGNRQAQGAQELSAPRFL